MDHEIQKIEGTLDAITVDVKLKFGGLTPEQINWKPSADGWSIGQCIDHLIKTTEIYSVDFRAVAKGERRTGLWERLSPLSGFFGKLLINAMANDEKKVKTSERFVPPSEIDAGIVEHFVKSQEELKETIRATEGVDRRRIILTSSFMKAVTYSLADAYEIVTAHQQRHIRQAERVAQLDDFPG